MRRTPYLLLTLAGALAWAAAAEHVEPAASALALRAEREAARGALREAAELWKQAAAAETAEPAQRFRALLRLCELERDLGRTRAALDACAQAHGLARAGLGPEREAAARIALASAQRAAGDFAAAARELDAAAALPLPSAALVSALENERGALHAAKGEAGAAREAFARAAAAADAAGAPALAFRARANAAFLYADDADTGASASIASARAAHAPLPIDHENAQTWLLLGRAGLRASARDASARDALLRGAESDLERALSMARELGDAAAESHALGALAELRDAQGLPAEALALARDAVREARRAQQPDAQIAWLALLARLERAAGDRAAALVHLEQAAALAAERRLAQGTAGFASPPDAHVGEREIYLELVDLLLVRAREQADPAAAAKDLRAAQQTLERFKAAELRDYFRDDCVDAYREKVRDPATASPRAAVIYPIALPDRLEILVSSQRGIRQFTVAVSAGELDAEAERFASLLRKIVTHEYLRPARRLHEWIVLPLLAHLEELGADTLVFVAGGSLRTVPMAALHDGQSFLIERYAVANTPGLELTDPRPVDAEGASVILAGLSQAVEDFPALAHVPGELGAVREIMGGRILLDGDFTVPSLVAELEAREWNVVHIATHGSFGPTAAETFLLTHDGRLGLDQLAAAVGAFRYRERPLDLILLSACETAAGDSRAALGLAGIAVKAGARSAVGTLWKVNDEATAVLVESFYRGLREPGVSRAAALQRAQRELLRDRRYRHPRYWSPFLLISNWL